MDTCLENFCNLPGSINFLLNGDVSYVAREVQIQYGKEMRHPCEWKMETCLLDIDEFHFTTFHRLWANTSRVSKFFVDSYYFNLKERRSESIDSKQISRLKIVRENGIKNVFNTKNTL
jgi:acyl-CoA thioesterase FadM